MQTQTTKKNGSVCQMSNIRNGQIKKMAVCKLNVIGADGVMRCVVADQSEGILTFKRQQASL
ncbi:MAG: hypothetical protein JSS32_04215 [Verrucomicrobia bacterium]|nr:hypothetical protein [Verrucomicrobiota bacterium]